MRPLKVSTIKKDTCLCVVTAQGAQWVLRLMLAIMDSLGLALDASSAVTRPASIRESVRA
jgi:hypothetical protein